MPRSSGGQGLLVSSVLKPAVKAGIQWLIWYHYEKAKKTPLLEGKRAWESSTDVNHPDVTNDSQSLRGQDSWRSDLNSYSCGALFRGHDLDTFPRNFMLYINKEVMHRKN